MSPKQISLIYSHSTRTHRLSGGRRPRRWIGLGNRFLSSLELRGLSPCTVRAYGYDLLALFRWLEERRQELREFRDIDWLDFLKTMRKQGLDPQTINRRLSTCRLFYEYVFPSKVSIRSKQRFWRSKNSLAGSYRRRGQSSTAGQKVRVPISIRLIEPLTPTEVAQFTESISRYRDLAIVALMLFNGLRCGEILALRTSNIDPDERTIRVLGKGRKERVIPIHSDAFDAVDRYFRHERPALCETDHVFVVLQGPRRGQPMCAAGLRNLFRYRRKVSGIQRANAHRFRHTFGTDMAKSGIRLPVLQRMMGHADPLTTLRYIHYSPRDLHEEYQRVLKQIQSRYAASGF